MLHPCWLLLEAYHDDTSGLELLINNHIRSKEHTVYSASATLTYFDFWKKKTWFFADPLNAVLFQSFSIPPLRAGAYRKVEKASESSNGSIDVSRWRSMISNWNRLYSRRQRSHERTFAPQSAKTAANQPIHLPFWSYVVFTVHFSTHLIIFERMACIFESTFLPLEDDSQCSIFGAIKTIKEQLLSLRHTVSRL